MYRKLLYTQHKNFLENRHAHVLVHDVQWLKNVTLITVILMRLSFLFIVNTTN